MIVAKRRHNAHRLAHQSRELDATITWISDTHIIAQYIDNEESIGQGESPDRMYYTVGAKLREFKDYTNYLQPDLAVHTGDSFDGDPYIEIAAMMSETYLGGIDASIPFKIIPGNHELAYISPDNLAPLYGREGEPIVAGSRFNYSLDLGDTTKIIFFDTVPYDPIDVLGRIDAAKIAWLEAELRAAGSSGKKRCVIFGHMDPHNYAGRNVFDETDALAISDMVSDVCNDYPTIRIAYCAGHDHPPTLLTYKNFHPHFIGYVTTSFVHYVDTNAMIVIRTYKNGDMEMDAVPLVYPYANIVPQ